MKVTFKNGEFTSCGAISGHNQQLYSTMIVQQEQHLDEDFEEEFKEDFEPEMGGMSL